MVAIAAKTETAGPLCTGRSLVTTDAFLLEPPVNEENAKWLPSIDLGLFSSDVACLELQSVRNKQVVPQHWKKCLLYYLREHW
jgi:hypothetical protein